MLVSGLAGVGSAMLLLCPDNALGKTPVKHTAKHAPKSSTVSSPKPVTALHRHRPPKDEVVNVSTTRHANSQVGQNLTAPLPHFSASYIIRFR